jgi:hypothetical protein
MVGQFEIAQGIKAIVYLADGIFQGYKWFMPLMVVFYFLRDRISIVSAVDLLKVMNRTLLAGMFLFLFSMISHVLLAWYSDNVAERELILSFATGPHWYQFYHPIFSFGLLPMLMLVRSFRSNVLISVVIVLVWILSQELVIYLTNLNSPFAAMKPRFDKLELASKLCLFLAIFVFMYMLDLRRKPAAVTR